MKKVLYFINFLIFINIMNILGLKNINDYFYQENKKVKDILFEMLLLFC